MQGEHPSKLLLTDANEQVEDNFSTFTFSSFGVLQPSSASAHLSHTGEMRLRYQSTALIAFLLSAYFGILLLGLISALQETANSRFNLELKGDRCMQLQSAVQLASDPGSTRFSRSSRSGPQSSRDLGGLLQQQQPSIAQMRPQPS